MGAWSESQCLEGSLQVAGAGDELTVVRNTGGGTSSCCSYYPVSAPARLATEDTIELQLKSRMNWHDMHKPVRNGARVYLADHCVEGHFARASYTSWPLTMLLSKTIAVTVDLSAATCGCATSFTLVPMRQNTDPGLCGGDYYCDPRSQCGVSCPEIALFEANRHAFKVRVHDAISAGGLENGLGGSSEAFTTDDYGPGRPTIDTLQPFRVHAFFASATGAELTDIEVTLEQAGRNISLSLVDPGRHHTDAGASNWYLRSVVEAIGDGGLTPVLAYRSAESMRSLDSPPCVYNQNEAQGDEQDDCGEVVRFSDISVTAGRFDAPHPPPPPVSPPPLPPPPTVAAQHPPPPAMLGAGLAAREKEWFQHMLEIAFPPPPWPPKASPPPPSPCLPTQTMHARPPPLMPALATTFVAHPHQSQATPMRVPELSSTAAKTSTSPMLALACLTIVGVLPWLGLRHLSNRKVPRAVGRSKKTARSRAPDDDRVPMATAVDHVVDADLPECDDAAEARMMGSAEASKEVELQ